MNPEEFYTKAVTLYDQGEIEKALSALNDAVCYDSRMVKAWFMKGVVHERLGHFEEALTAINVTLKLASLHSEAWYFKGLVLWKLKDSENASLAFKKTLEISPNHIGALYMQGRLLADIGRYNEAFLAFKKTSEIHPKYVGALYMQGVVLAKLGRYSDALVALNEALKYEPKNADAWHSKGNVLRNLGSDNEALSSYENALSISSKSYQVMTAKGNVLRNLGRYTDALTTYEEALRLNPSYAPTWNGKGGALNDLKRHKEAIQASETALHLDPKFALAFSNMGLALQSLDRKWDAIKAFEAALRIEPELTQAWIYKGELLQELGYGDDSYRCFLRAIDTANNNPNLGLLRESMASFSVLISNLAGRGANPLLVSMIARNHGLQEVFIRLPQMFTQAFRDAEPYFIIKTHFDSNKSDIVQSQIEEILGLIAFYLGDPFIAEEHFLNLVDIDYKNMLGYYYLIQCYYSSARNYAAETLLSHAREIASKLVEYPENTEAKQLYYTGHLFITGSDVRYGDAIKCFEIAANNGFIQATFMLAYVIKNQLGKDDGSLENIINNIIAYEQSQTLDNNSTGKSYLLAEIRGSFKEVVFRDLDNDLIETELIESLYWYANISELTDAIYSIWDWLEDKNNQVGKLPNEYAFFEVGSRPDILNKWRKWIFKYSEIENSLNHIIEEASQLEITKLRSDLIKVYDIQDAWLDIRNENSLINEIRIGNRIYNHFRSSSKNNLSADKALLHYLILTKQLDFKATMSLATYYLLAELKVLQSDKHIIFENYGSAAISSALGYIGGTVGLNVPIFWGALGASLGAVAGLVIARYIKIMRNQPLTNYETFRDKFNYDLNDLPDEILEQLREPL